MTVIDQESYRSNIITMIPIGQELYHYHIDTNGPGVYRGNITTMIAMDQELYRANRSKIRRSTVSLEVPILLAVHRLIGILNKG